ncbi:helix-turn-helix domain-containing protein [Streptomyces sp. E11-3]|uniref:ArsR/SmtB family transcription factor n=1 Tax=Streptomyces sp. E11-3 TaxID=3110112 RepID=UPI0039808040
MLRIHFTADDLARVRVVDRPHLLWETVLSLHRMRDRTAAADLDGWRAGARRRLTAQPERGRRAAGVLSALVPLSGDFPDLLTPTGPQRGIEDALDQVSTTPNTRLAREIRLLNGDRGGPPDWLRPLADGDREAVGLLAESLRDYHAAAVAPYWDRIRAQVDADRALCARALLDGGTEGLLAALRPALRWRPPVLEADYPVARELRLGGRGLVLVPSYFCALRPVTLVDPTLPPVLVYPVRRTAALRTPLGAGPLERLIGRTRSTVLASVDGGCTTGELARRVGVSPASASQHATVLREAGLLVTVRDGVSVLHTLTPLPPPPPLGAALLGSERSQPRNGPVTS